MNIYQHGETGRICEAYAAPGNDWRQCGGKCENCGKVNDCWEFSNYCSSCRNAYHDRATGETKPYDERPCNGCKWQVQ